jgi:hypothetical protein
VSDAPFTSDAGLLPLRQFDERIGLTSQFAAALDDPRDPELTEHTFPEMVRSRIFGILAGYEDQNDHDTLRTDQAERADSGTWRRRLRQSDPARGSDEPAGAVASRDRRSTASATGRRARGVSAATGAEAVSERAASARSPGRGSAGDVA